MPWVSVAVSNKPVWQSQSHRSCKARPHETAEGETSIWTPMRIHSWSVQGTKLSSLSRRDQATLLRTPVNMFNVVEGSPPLDSNIHAANIISPKHSFLCLWRWERRYLFRASIFSPSEGKKAMGIHRIYCANYFSAAPWPPSWLLTMVYASHLWALRALCEMLYKFSLMFLQSK